MGAARASNNWWPSCIRSADDEVDFAIGRSAGGNRLAGPERCGCGEFCEKGKGGECRHDRFQ